MAEGGAAKRKQQRNRERAAEMKRLDIERTTGRCAQCYRIVTVDSRKSRYTHICK
jgi:hypothetical protein